MHFIDMSYPDDVAQTPDRRRCVWMDGWMEGQGRMDRQTARLIHSIGLTDSFIHSFDWID